MLNTSFWERSQIPTFFLLNGKLNYCGLTTPNRADLKENVLTFNEHGVYNLVFAFDYNNNYQFFINLKSKLRLKLRIYFFNSADTLKINLGYNLAPESSLEILSSNEGSKYFTLTNQVMLTNSSSFYQSFQYNFPIFENNFISLNQDSKVKIIGGNYLTNNTNIKQNWHIIHNANNSESNLLIKNILNHQANAELFALVKIPHYIKNAVTNVKNKNLLLSSEAKITTKPQLEINSESILATHGTSIGNISPETIFYLQSRGLTVKDAMMMLTKAFLEEVYELFPKFS